MERKKRNKLLVAAGIIVVALSALILAANYYVKSVINNQFAKLTEGRYQLTVSDVKVNLLRRTVTLSDLVITPSIDAPMTNDSASAPPVYLFDFSAKQLFIAGIHLKKGNQIEISKLRLLSPKVKVQEFRANGIVPDSARRINPIRIGIEQITISDGYAEYGYGDTLRNVIEGLEFSTERLLVDVGEGASISPFGDNMTLSVARIKHRTQDESICMEIDSLDVEMAGQTIRIRSFAVIPTYSKEQFGWKSWKHKDWTQARLSDISFNGVDFQHLIANGELLIDSIHLTKGSFSSYKNRNIMRDEWIKPLYHQMIQRLPVKFAVRKSVIGSFDAQYEELKLGGDKPGIITFNQIGGEIEWLSNIPTPDRAYSEWRLRANLMNAAPLVVTVFMPIDSLNDRFELAAILGKMEMTTLNGMVKPLTNIEIKGGTIEKLDCLITGNTHKASIDMTLLYNGLDLALLKEKNGRLKENLFVSEIINNIVLLNSNPLHNKTRRSHQTSQRDPYRSPWNFLWRTTFAGVKETIGFGKL